MHALDLDRDGPLWPTFDRGRLVHAGGLAGFVVQDGPQGAPEALLLHGVSGTTHCFGALIPELTDHLRITAIDLPGHGFTEMPQEGGLTRPAMARWVAAVLAEIGSSPSIAIGHSAGAGVAIEMVLDGLFAPSAIVGVNPSLAEPRSMPIPGPLAAWGSGLVPDRIVASILARLAKTEAFVDQVLKSTHSRVPDTHVRCYHRIAQHSVQVQAAIGMMLGWRPNDMVKRLGGEEAQALPPITLIAGSRDRWVTPREIADVAERFPTRPRVVELDEGHLAPEASPREVAELILGAARETGLLV